MKIDHNHGPRHVKKNRTPTSDQKEVKAKKPL